MVVMAVMVVVVVVVIVTTIMLWGEFVAMLCLRSQVHRTEGESK